MKKYVIDGYNLLNSPAYSAPLDWNLEQRRDHLIKLIKSNSQFERCEVIIVFDNSMFSKTSGSSTSGKVQIRFTQPSMEADELIKKIIRKEKNPARLIVVSSDRAIQFAAKDHGAGTLSSEDYCRLVEKRPFPSSGKTSPGFNEEKYDPNLGEKEVQYWKRLFEQGDEGE
jgi:predicted RNA-binding protein with PIN domain